MRRISIKESVGEFYLKNRFACKQCYNKSRSISALIYLDISNTNEINTLFSSVDVIILTANVFEKNLLHYQIINEESKIKRLRITLLGDDRTNNVADAFYFQFNNYNILHIHAPVIGSYVQGGAADVVRFIQHNDYLYPQLIVSLGICFGTNEKNNALGDVVLSERVFPYFMGIKISEEGCFITTDNIFKLNSSLKTSIQSLLDANVFKDCQYSVVFGNYITGEAVISCKSIRNTFSGLLNQKITAGEMEGYGVFKESNTALFQIPCVIVKSICDWAAYKNMDFEKLFKQMNKNIDTEECKKIKDYIQSYSANNSCETLLKLLENHLVNASVLHCLKNKIIETNATLITGITIKNSLKDIFNQKNIRKEITDAYFAIILQKLSDILNICHQEENPELNTYVLRMNK